jgi:multidrug efflux pump subunit AcrB
MGVKLLPEIPAKAHGHRSIYGTKNYERFRRLIRACVDHKWMTLGVTAGLFAASVAGMAVVKKQFFPNSDRTELTLEINLPAGSAFAVTERTVRRIEAAMLALPEAKHVTSYIGEGAPRFFFSLNSELPNPAFAQVVIQTQDPKQRDILKNKIRELVAEGRFPEARVRVTQFLFGPPVPYPVLFRVTGGDLNEIRRIADAVRLVMEKNPHLRDVHLDWGEKTPVLHLAFDEERLHLVGLNPQSAALQLQAILQGATVSQMRSGNRTVDIQVRSPKIERDALDAIGDVVLRNEQGRSIPLRQITRIETRMEDAVLKRYNRELFIAVQGDVVDGVQPPDVTAEVLPQLASIKAALPDGYRIDTGGSVEESAKANKALVLLFPVMILTTLALIMFQVRSFSATFMAFATGPLGLVGAVPALIIFDQAFGFNAILGLIGLSGILIRNTLILVDQIQQEKAAGLSNYEAIIESTVRRARPVVLTAVAAMLAFIPLTHSSFWGALAYVLIGGVGAGTVLTLLFLPALYAVWFKVKTPRFGESGGAVP